MGVDRECNFAATVDVTESEWLLSLESSLFTTVKPFGRSRPTFTHRPTDFPLIEWKIFDFFLQFAFSNL